MPHFPICPGIEIGIQPLARRCQALHCFGHAQVQRMGQRTQLDAIGHRAQDRGRQQTLHHWQHLGHVRITTAEVMVAIHIGQEEARRRLALRVVQEMLEAVLQAFGLPLAQQRQPAQPVAWLLPRVMQGLVPFQATAKPFDEGIATCHALDDPSPRQVIASNAACLFTAASVSKL